MKCYNVYMIFYEMDDITCTEKFYTKTPQEAMDEFCKWNEFRNGEMTFKSLHSYDNENDRCTFEHKVAWVDE